MRSVRREGWTIRKVGGSFSCEITEEHIGALTQLFCNIHSPINYVELAFEVTGNKT
jgi:hypothetical protein